MQKLVGKGGVILAKQSKTYLAIDLKSFYGSVECVERGLDPLTTNLVVADESRTDKTICLAVTPSLKSYGIPGRERLFNVIAKVKEANCRRQLSAPGRTFSGESYDSKELNVNPTLAISYITAPPRMALYMEYSTRIYDIYLKYVAPEDIHVYSIDEVFIDAMNYLPLYGKTGHEFAMEMIRDVLAQTGITATAGIGTNMYLAKVAMDIVAKKIPADKDGVRIAELDELSYRKKLWTHRPLTDFWRLGRGYARKLEAHGIFTMGDIARCSIGGPGDYYNEDLLYEMFGINAELLIDHSWGWEPCAISDIKSYKPEAKSIGSGQVLQYPYTNQKARVIVREMVELLALDLVDKGLVTNQIVLTIGYDIENLTTPSIRQTYHGPVTTDAYGRKVPKHAHGTENLPKYTSSTKLLVQAALALYDRITDPNLLVRRVTLSANRVVDEHSDEAKMPEGTGQLSLFSDYQAEEKKRAEEDALEEREKRMQKAILSIQKKYGKNAILKGPNFEEGATTRERNNQIGGHRA